MLSYKAPFSVTQPCSSSRIQKGSSKYLNIERRRICIVFIEPKVIIEVGSLLAIVAFPVVFICTIPITDSGEFLLR